MVAGAHVLRRGMGAVAAAFEAIMEAARDIMTECVVARHRLRLRLGKLHQFGIDADRCESVILAIPGNHRGRYSRIDLRVLGRKAAIEARLACRQITLARAGAKERRRRDRADARAKAQVRESKHDAGTPLPLSSRCCAHRMAERWRCYGGQCPPR